ncbi:uncharacterized protein F5147DRAFT_576659 [Suillus discolor]|uniref:Tyr recombinase domain-containing protein n=1 Tax=Suillus discolor TaxID=1912936 RepID=A0A9P7F8A5_9AGAM|nr:uncharacterized protein F5147DRAFT_576659 [Suillus discolor]KAG2108730.1 hypothetical protein F5147DRAFT_576659 [Suillus discolor]
MSTRECYGAGLLVFHFFCDERTILKEQCCLVDMRTMLNFMSSCTGSYSRKTLANYVYAIKAWHRLHGQLWEVQQDELRVSLDGVLECTPEMSKHMKCKPFSTNLILQIRSHLDLSRPLDTTVYVCLTTAFYALCHLGELTVRALNAFDLNKHVKRSNVQINIKDRHDLLVTKIFLPRTKTLNVSQSMFWTQQDNLTDPKAALLNHFAVNNPGQNVHLFAWKHAKGMRPLMRTEFWKQVSRIIKGACLGNLKGHGLHIGGTLEYLLHGVPFDVVKSMGRWSSEAFMSYLHKHALILAPYLQGSPALEPFIRYTMPPVYRQGMSLRHPSPLKWESTLHLMRHWAPSFWESRLILDSPQVRNNVSGRKPFGFEPK